MACATRGAWCIRRYRSYGADRPAESPFLFVRPKLRKKCAETISLAKRADLLTCSENEKDTAEEDQGGKPCGADGRSSSPSRHWASASWSAMGPRRSPILPGRSS